MLRSIGFLEHLLETRMRSEKFGAVHPATQKKMKFILHLKTTKDNKMKFIYCIIFISTIEKAKKKAISRNQSIFFFVLVY